MPAYPTPREQLVATTRELMEAVGVTCVDDAAMTEADRRLQAAIPQLRAATSDRVPAPTYDESVGADHYHSAALNPGVPRLDIEFAEGRARAQAVTGVLHQGPAGSVHGGVISYFMDTLLACLVQQQGRLCVTASLRIDYRARTPLGRLDLEAWVSEVHARKVVVTGTITCRGQVTVRAEAVFVTVAAR